jgi:hypothetical protein
MSVFYRLPNMEWDARPVPNYTMKDKYGTDVTLWRHYKDELTEIIEWIRVHEIYPMPKIEFHKDEDYQTLELKVGVYITFINPHDELLFRMQFL